MPSLTVEGGDIGNLGERKLFLGKMNGLLEE